MRFYCIFLFLIVSIFGYRAESLCLKETAYQDFSLKHVNFQGLYYKEGFAKELAKYPVTLGQYSKFPPWQPLDKLEPAPLAVKDESIIHLGVHVWAI